MATDSPPSAKFARTSPNSMAGAASIVHASRRLIVVDVARGIAIAGVVLFHLVWDLEFTGFVSGIARHSAWLIFGHCLAGSFMVLVGVSLVLAHRESVRWPAVARRLAVIVVSAMAITVATLLAFPDAFIYFGILHAIAAATLIGVAFLRLPATASLAVGVAIVALPFFLESTAFDSRWLAWIGFSTYPPPSNDYVPIFPWAGLTLIGIAATKWALVRGIDRRLPTYPPQGPTAVALTWLGRHSLAIYLLHQPLLLAVIVPLAQVLQD